MGGCEKVNCELNVKVWEKGLIFSFAVIQYNHALALGSFEC